MGVKAEPAGQVVDPDEITVAKAAVKQFVLENVPSWAASYVSDAEETALATAVVAATTAYRSGKEV